MNNIEKVSNSFGDWLKNIGIGKQEKEIDYSLSNNNNSSELLEEYNKNKNKISLISIISIGFILGVSFYFIRKANK